MEVTSSCTIQTRLPPQHIHKQHRHHPPRHRLPRLLLLPRPNQHHHPPENPPPNQNGPYRNPRSQPQRRRLLLRRIRRNIPPNKIPQHPPPSPPLSFRTGHSSVRRLPPLGRPRRERPVAVRCRLGGTGGDEFVRSPRFVGGGCVSGSARFGEGGGCGAFEWRA